MKCQAEQILELNSALCADASYHGDRKENDYEYYRTMRKLQAKQSLHDVLENKQQEMSVFYPKNKRRPHPGDER